MLPAMLLISAIAPFPSTSGGATRIYYTLKYLSRRYQLHFLTFGQPPTQREELDFLDRHCASWQFFPLAKRTVLAGTPYYFSSWRSGALERQMAKLLDQQPIAKVRIEFTQLANLIKYLPARLPTTLVAHDVSTVSFARRSRELAWGHTGWDVARKLYAHATAVEVKGFERFYLPRFSEVVAVSAHDAQLVRDLFGVQTVRVEPNGVDRVVFLPRRPKSSLTFGYLGSPVHPPNHTAIRLIIDRILPRLDRRQLDYQLVLAGADYPPQTHPRVQLLGPVARPRDFFAQVDFLLAPLTAGSGTRVKILESLSCGVPVITTPVGAEGLDIESPFLCQVTAANPDELAAASVEALLESWTHGGQFTRESVRRQLRRQLTPYLWANSFAAS